jgi:signal transduction histidine kinase
LKNIKLKLKWAQAYQVALSKHLARGAGVNLRLSAGLGRQAVKLGMETLDVARFHEKALTSLVSPDKSAAARKRMIRDGKKFFAETIVPIEKTHQAALNDDVRVTQLTDTLNRKAVESSASDRHLEQGIASRQAAEAALKKSGKHRVTLMRESNRLKKRLKDQTRVIISKHEDKRRNVSSQLQNEIAQSMLAINLRLLMLNKSAHAGTESLKKEIAETQRVVKHSVKRFKRFAHEFVIKHKA